MLLTVTNLTPSIQRYILGYTVFWLSRVTRICFANRLSPAIWSGANRLSNVCQYFDYFFCRELLEDVPSTNSKDFSISHVFNA